MKAQKIANQILIRGECIEVMSKLKDNSVDMIMSDLPYQTTQNSWDTLIPFEPLWKEWNRILKPDSAVVLTAQQPFESLLVASNIKQFKYDWVWNKQRCTGHLNAKKRPMRQHESILIFSNGKVPYNPVMTQKEPDKIRKGNVKRTKLTDNYGTFSLDHTRQNPDDVGYPTSIVSFNRPNTTIHPTQKPVDLFEYLIKTYSNKGHVILDCCSGSGTTAIAAYNTNRTSICIEQDETYYAKSVERLKEHICNQTQS